MNRVCLVCGGEFKPCKPTSTTCSPKCRNTYNARNSAAKRSETLRGRGMRKAYAKLHSRHIHRIVAEQMLGRSLEKGEIVHHIDNNKLNNHPSNLMVMTQAEHARLHSIQRWQGVKRPDEVAPNA